MNNDNNKWLLTTIINDPEIQKLHGQKLHKTEGELLDLKFRPDKDKKVKVDEEGFVLREEGEDNEAFVTRLEEISEEYRKTVAVTDWVEEQHDRRVNFIHLTDYTNENLRKIILNYYYKENIEYIFYDTLKTDTEHIINDALSSEKTVDISWNCGKILSICKDYAETKQGSHP